MAYTAEQLQTLKDAYAQGVLEVQYGDKKIVYRSKDDMKELIAEIEGTLQAATGNTGLRKKFVSFNKGLQ
jgi:hypothetical protein